MQFVCPFKISSLCNLCTTLFKTKNVSHLKVSTTFVLIQSGKRPDVTERLMNTQTHFFTLLFSEQRFFHIVYLYPLKRQEKMQYENRRLLKSSAANNYLTLLTSKHGGPRSDCSYRSSLICVHTVCHRAFLNISADEKSRRLLLRLAL